MHNERSLGDKLSGRFRHPEDAGGKTTLTGRLFRLPGTTGRMAGLELPEAPKGVVSVVAGDIPGVTRITLGATTLPVLGGREISWDGQPVLAAAGPDSDVLDEWLLSVSSRLPESDEKTENHNPNSSYERSRGDAKGQFAKAFQVIEETFSIPSQPPEGKARTVSCIRDGGNYIIHAACSWPGAIRRSVSRVLKTDRSNIRVRPYPAGGYQTIWLPVLDAAHAALLSRSARKSVRLSIPASEARKWGPSRPGAKFRIRGAVDAGGRLTAVDIDFTLETGALFPFETEFLDRMILGFFSIYPCRHYQITGSIIRSRTTPSAHGPGMGFELGFLAAEIVASRVAELSLQSPGNWRMESMPHPNQAFGPGLTLPRNFPLPKVLGRTIEVSDFERKYSSYEQTRLNRNKLSHFPSEHRGIGISNAWFGNGFVASARELGAATVNATLDKDGILTIDIPLHTANPAMIQAWSKVAEEILGVESSSVRFPMELPPDRSDSGPSILGRNVSVYTKLIELACIDLSKRRFRDPLPITVSRTRRKNSRIPWSEEDFEGMAFESISWGGAAVEVVVPSDTSVPRVNRIWISINAGNLLMPDNARAAVENSVEHALTWCMGNKTVPEPLVDIQFIQGKKNPRDVSTLPWLTIPAACVMAVRQATGSEITALPIIPNILSFGECR